MSRKVQEAIDTEAREARMVEVEERREKGKKLKRREK